MNIVENQRALQQTQCYHCGKKSKHSIKFEDCHFCCNGCLTVYQILRKNQLCQYYDFNEMPGQTILESVQDSKFLFLEDESVLQKLIHFKLNSEVHIRFYLPQVHCSSCLYLLENLYKIHLGVLSAKLNFTKKELTLAIDTNKTSIKSRGYKGPAVVWKQIWKQHLFISNKLQTVNRLQLLEAEIIQIKIVKTWCCRFLFWKYYAIEFS